MKRNIRVESANNGKKSHFPKMCAKTAAGVLTLVMVGTCVPAINPAANTMLSVEVSAAEVDNWLNEDGSLKDGIYNLPLTMKNASNPEKDSMAASCIKGASIEVKDGKGTVTVDLQAVSVGPITGWAKDWKVYQQNETAGDTVDAEVTASDEEGHTTQIKFGLPEGAWEWKGTFMNCTVDVMEMSVDAWFSMDFANAERIGGEEPSEDVKPGEDTTKPAEENTKPAGDAVKPSNTAKPAQNTVSVKKGTAYKAGVNKYVVTGTGTQKTVAYAGTVKAKQKNVKIPASVKIGGTVYKVTSIKANAFKNNKKLRSIVIGKNVTTIGKKAFAGCKNLKKITVKTTKLKKVAPGALKGINNKAVIKVPAKKLAKYTKVFKNKGQSKTVKIRK